MENQKRNEAMEELAKVLALVIMSIEPDDFAKFINRPKTSQYENIRSLSEV